MRKVTSGERFGKSTVLVSAVICGVRELVAAFELDMVEAIPFVVITAKRNITIDRRIIISPPPSC
jgi:hypothetical protein